MPHIVVGTRRYNNDEYTYVKASNSHNSIEKHLGCPACTTHCVEINKLKTHYYTSHSETMSEQSQQPQEQRAAKQQQSNNSEERSNKRRSSNILYNELLDPSYLSFPPPDCNAHLLVKNFDAKNAFHMLQLSIYQYKWKLSLENHIHCAMAATSILLLSRNQHSEELSPYFDEDGLNAVIDSTEAMYGIKKPRIPM